jgi:hypothetical protein
VIDPAVDEARFFVMQDLIKSNAVTKFAALRAISRVSDADPRRDAENDAYFTNGLRLVSLSLHEIEVVAWANLPLLEPFRHDGVFRSDVENDRSARRQKSPECVTIVTASAARCIHCARHRAGPVPRTRPYANDETQARPEEVRS